MDSIYNRVFTTGTSDYSGQEFTFSGLYHSRYVTLGFSVKTPTTITRKFNTQIQTDTTGSSKIVNANGQDKTVIPFRGTLGLSIALRENLMFGAGYEIRPYLVGDVHQFYRVDDKPVVVR